MKMEHQVEMSFWLPLWATEMADTNFQGAKALTFAYTSSGYKKGGYRVTSQEISVCRIRG
jgi:hypothetical protein